jgi:hypothetical protein
VVEPYTRKGYDVRFKIEHDGGGVYVVYRMHWRGWWKEFIGVELSEGAAMERIKQASQYPKYVEV